MGLDLTLGDGHPLWGPVSSGVGRGTHFPLAHLTTRSGRYGLAYVGRKRLAFPWMPTKRWLLSTNPKEMGTLYLLFAIEAGVDGTLFSMRVRIERVLTGAAEMASLLSAMLFVPGMHGRRLCDGDRHPFSGTLGLAPRSSPSTSSSFRWPTSNSSPQLWTPGMGWRWSIGAGEGLACSLG